MRPYKCASALAILAQLLFSNQIGTQSVNAQSANGSESYSLANGIYIYSIGTIAVTPAVNPGTGVENFQARAEYQNSFGNCVVEITPTNNPPAFSTAFGDMQVMGMPAPTITTNSENFIELRSEIPGTVLIVDHFVHDGNFFLVTKACDTNGDRFIKLYFEYDLN